MTQADVSTPGHTPIPCNLVLIGFMGTGKSTVSDYFHTAYNMDVIEMDQIIARREGMCPSRRNAVPQRRGTLLRRRRSNARAQRRGDEENRPCHSFDS